MVKLLSVSELAERIRRTDTAVYGLRKRGGLPPAALLAGRLGWRDDDIESWLAGIYAAEPVGPSDAAEWVAGVPLLTLAETAAAIGRSTRTIRHMRAAGDAPRGAVVGGQLLFRADDVSAFVDYRSRLYAPTATPTPTGVRQ
ncbi:helix-turn-helix transcriptional regulator [Microbacterium sp. NPDC056234]|uniref:helix-turn-helix transcriptional regulator n=1 Tax=Microbacterium sp. NPDC056234 TaxID=3345757 RepID=UPI0035DFFF16